MIARILVAGLLLTTTQWTLAQNKREIIPRDSITDKYAYQGVVVVDSATLSTLTTRIEKWQKKQYNAAESKYASVVRDGDTHTMHDREAFAGRARKFIEYDLTVDLKDGRYRHKLGQIEYIAVGKYPLEDKMATDKRSDFEEIDTICKRILASLEAAMKQGDDW